jgi:hypothetical protein
MISWATTLPSFQREGYYAENAVKDENHSHQDTKVRIDIPELEVTANQEDAYNNESGPDGNIQQAQDTVNAHPVLL